MVKKNTAHLSLKLLGAFELRDPAGADVRLPTRKAKALLAYLATQPSQRQSREKLMDLLWGERSDKQARHSLNQTLVHIRKAVAGGDILESDRERVALVPESIEVDVSDFRELLTKRPSEAMELYGGSFLDGIGIREAVFEDWVSAQRSEYRALACRALKAQSERCVREGRQAEAIEVGKRLVTLDPLCEEAQRQLMRCYDEIGDRTSALKQYRSCAAILERELQVAPAGETTRLFEEIKNRNRAPGAGAKGDEPHRHSGLDAAGPPRRTRKPSIAVLPFENMSDDRDQEYFSDGVTEDIITELSRYPDFLVIARNSTFQYKNTNVDLRQIGRNLGVQYLLEGSVRRAGNNLRLSAQLIDAATGAHLWAERYDRTLDDIFAVQDELTETIVGTIGETLQEERVKSSLRKDPSSLDAYDKTLQAWASFSRFSKAGIAEARTLSEAAIELDPQYARAYAILAHTYLMEFSSHWADDPDEALRKGYETARRAVSLDDQNVYAYLGLGGCETWLGQHQQAIAHMRRAIRLNRNDADVHAYFANMLVFAGQAEEAFAELATAMRLNPHYPEWYLQFLGRAYFVQRRYEEAEAAFERVVTVNPGWPWAHLVLAATRAALGKTEAAGAEVAEALRTSPGITLAFAPKAWPFKDPADLEHIMDLLRKAGLPE